MQRVLTLKDRKEWSELVKEADIFFTPEFCEIAQKQLNGKAELFVSDGVAQPYIKRSLKELPFYDLKEEYFDIVSPEFSGPFSKANASKDYFDEFHKHCAKNNIITEYTQLNPFFNNHVAKLANAELKRRTVYIDLTKNERVLWTQMKKSNKNSISKAIREGVKVKESEDIDAFYEIYISTMKRLEAGKDNFYPKEYFAEMFNALKGSIKLFVAEYDGKIVSASLFLMKKPYITYYLSGFLPEYSSQFPNNLLLYSVMQWAKQNGFKTLNLTGGRKIGDSLHKFKSSFSNTETDYYVYSKIHNKELYNQMCDKAAGKGKDIKTTSFFPAYRG